MELDWLVEFVWINIFLGSWFLDSIPLKVGGEPASPSPLGEETAGALHKLRTFKV